MQPPAAVRDHRPLSAFCLLALTLALAGCSAGEVPVYPVRGRVLDKQGKPAAGALIVLQPLSEEAKSTRAVGRTDDNGEFKLTTRTEGDGAPAVYMIEPKIKHDAMKDPNARMAKTAPKRPFDRFETEALEKLREGNDLMVRISEQEIRAFGAVRARNECLSCHKVEVGTMLGAFTYTLHRRTPISQNEGNHATVVH